MQLSQLVSESAVNVDMIVNNIVTSLEASEGAYADAHLKAGEEEAEPGAAAFGKWAGQYQPGNDGEPSAAVLDDSLDILQRINLAGRQSLIQAVSETVTHDGRLTLSEAEMLRAICASLDCPLPPILAIGSN